MDQKIAWYQEVLELEPSSKVFFPLARLLLRDGHNDYAIDVLKKGLCHHKDFFEARLMLIELLHNAGDAEACDAEVRTLLAFFANYPQFWSAWGACLAHDGAHNDVSLAMRFIAASQKCSEISFASLLDKGLQSLEKKDVVSAHDIVLHSEQEQCCESGTLPLQIEDTDSVCDFIQDAYEQDKSIVDSVNIVQPVDYADFLLQERQGNSIDESFVQDSVDVPACDLSTTMETSTALPEEYTSYTEGRPALHHADAVHMPQASCSSEAEFYSDVELEQPTSPCGDEKLQEHTASELFTLKTRSMAEVLVSQGDVHGALSIYRELLHKEKTDSGRCEIQGCIDALQENKSSCDAIEIAPQPCHGQEKLLQMLTLLAERLDNRAQ